MPLGKILKLLAEAFQKIPAEPTNTSELLKTLSSANVETTEKTETASTNIPERNQAQNPQTTPANFEEKAMINISILQDELQNFVSGTSDIQGAALVSPDGLALASVLPGGMDEERTAAMSASMLSLGERICRELARGNVDRIVVEGEKGYGVLVGCGNDAVLLILASANVKQGLLFLEIKRAVTKIAPLLG